MNIIKYKGKITLLSPLSHNSDETLGTTTTYRRMAMWYNGKTVDVPIYTGNAFRGILRRVGAKQLFDKIGVKQDLSPKLYHTFFTGGLLEAGSDNKGIDVGQLRTIRQNLPFLSVFATSLPNKIMQGLLKMDIAYPICKETAAYTGIESDISFWELISTTFYTRRDDFEGDKGKKDDKKDEQAHQMKFEGEFLVPGTVFDHAITLKGTNELEQSCFGAIMQEFLQNPILGGNSRIGHGKVRLEYEPAFADGKLYLDFLEDNKDVIKNYLLGMVK